MKHGDPINPHRLWLGILIPMTILSSDLSLGAKLLFGLLNKYAGRNAKCFPRQRKLAYDMGCSERQIRRYVKELVDEELIKIQPPTLDEQYNKYNFIWHSGYYEDPQDRSVTHPIGQTCPQEQVKPVLTDKRIIEENQLSFYKKNKKTLSLPKKRQRRRTAEGLFVNQEPKEVPLPPSIKPLVDYYYKIIPITRPGSGTKTMEENVKALQKLKRGTLLGKFYPKYEGRKFTDNEIIKVFDAHKLALDPAFEFRNKSVYKIHLHLFLANRFAKKNISYFVKWFENPPQRTQETSLEDKHPDYTKYLVAKLNGGKPLPIEEMNKVIRASARTVKWFVANQKLMEAVTSEKRIELLWRAVEEDKNRGDLPITAGFLCSDTTFSKRLPDYCDRQALFRMEYTGKGSAMQAFNLRERCEMV